MDLIRICFDCETDCKGKKTKKEALITPYLIGFSWANIAEEQQAEVDWFNDFGNGTYRERLEWVCHRNKRTNHLIEKPFGYKFTAEEFVDFLIEKANGGKNKIELVGYNVFYDLTIILSYLIKDPRVEGYKLECQISDRKSFVGCDFKHKNLSFFVTDLWLWDRNMSFAKWMKKIKDEFGDENLDIIPPKKGKIDYDKNEVTYDPETQTFHYFNVEGGKKAATATLKDELAYLKIDVLGLWFIYDKIQEQKGVIFDKVRHKLNLRLKKFRLRKWFATIAGYAKHIYDWYLTSTYSISFDWFFRNYEIIDIAVEIALASFGGFTAYNKLFLDGFISPEGKIRKDDNNSMYPFAMSGRMPVGKTKKTPDGLLHPQVWYVCEVTRMEWVGKYVGISQTPIPLYKFTDSVKPLHRLWITKELYDLVDSMTENDLVIKEVRYQDTSPVLAPLIDELYEIKLRKDIKKEDRDLCKLLMNSPYGKMVERNYTEKFLYTAQEFNWLKVVHKELKKLRCNLSGVFVIQDSRRILLTTIKKVIDAGNIFLYCDTDSIVYEEKYIVDYLKDQEKLGYFKNEDYFHYFKYYDKSKKWEGIYCTGGFKDIQTATSEETKDWVVKNALSGIKKDCQAVLKEKFTAKQCWDFFDNTRNFLIVNGSNECRRTERLGHMLIRPKHIQSNVRFCGIITDIIFWGGEAGEGDAWVEIHPWSKKYYHYLDNSIE